MNRRGVCHDAGRVMWGQDWRPEFSPEEARRELQIIRDDLRCHAVRICGQDLGRLMAAGRHALDCGLQVWLSPELWDHSPGETLGCIAKAAGPGRAASNQTRTPSGPAHDGQTRRGTATARPALTYASTGNGHGRTRANGRLTASDPSPHAVTKQGEEGSHTFHRERQNPGPPWAARRQHRQTAPNRST